ncbi:UV radiation resistance protein and autophagy-related subunit 14-domain-containing protein [Amanita rubescens]|nr:UV radiation resistance protein and autophagy-related subunit 14-domain-containing protein [Amanita rubescens]
MECKICELKQKQFYCETCIRTHLRDLRRQIQHFCIDRDEQVNRASRALESVAPARIRRADVASYQQLLEDIQFGLVKLRKENDKRRDRLRLLRETVATRRRNLSAAKLHSTSFVASSPIPPSAPPTFALHQTASREKQELNALSLTISRARSGLVQELVEVFNVVEVGGRPPIGGKPGTKGEWTIGTLTLPVPGDMRRYPPDHINAVITHTVHFLSLLTFYIGIKLPFEISWSSGKLGVGQPWIGAGKGAETGGWARYRSIKTLPGYQLLTRPPITRRWTGKYCLHTSSPVDPPTLSTSPSGNHQAGDVLSNLWRVCCSTELGKKSHETTPILPPPTPANFPLDFSQLLQATTANPVSRARVKLATTSSR